MGNKVSQDIYVHPSAEVAPGVVIGQGSKVWHQVQICEGATIGCDCRLGKGVFIDQGVTIGNKVKIQNGVSVYYGVTVEDEVFIGPHVAFTNDRHPRSFNTNWVVTPTKLMQGASVGANATIVCGVIVGRYAMVGAGAVVTRHVPDFALVVGNPAKIVGYVCYCGQQLAEGGVCPVCQITVRIRGK
ncbi:MAG: acyltransferase [Thermincolia bacterium]